MVRRCSTISTLSFLCLTTGMPTTSYRKRNNRTKKPWKMAVCTRVRSEGLWPTHRAEPK
jgi:hypothetical protein